MSTNCIRVVEYKNRKDQWIRCDKVSDNFHGFDKWRFEEFADRGLPNDCTVSPSEYTDTICGEEKDVSWGKSYVTLDELERWIAGQREEACAFLYRDMANTQFGYIVKLLKKETITEENIVNDVEFKETFEECLDWFEGQQAELSAACAVAHLKCDEGDKQWIPLDRVRIVYWFE